MPAALPGRSRRLGRRGRCRGCRLLVALASRESERNQYDQDHAPESLHRLSFPGGGTTPLLAQVGCIVSTPGGAANGSLDGRTSLRRVLDPVGSFRSVPAGVLLLGCSPGRVDGRSPRRRSTERQRGRPVDPRAAGAVAPSVRRDFALLVASRVSSRLGDGFLRILAVLLVAAKSNDPMVAGLVLVFRYVSEILINAVSGRSSTGSGSGRRSWRPTSSGRAWLFSSSGPSGRPVLRGVPGPLLPRRLRLHLLQAGRRQGSQGRFPVSEGRGSSRSSTPRTTRATSAGTPSPASWQRRSASRGRPARSGLLLPLVPAGLASPPSGREGHRLREGAKRSWWRASGRGSATRGRAVPSGCCWSGVRWSRSGRDRSPSSRSPTSRASRRAFVLRLLRVGPVGREGRGHPAGDSVPLRPPFSVPPDRPVARRGRRLLLRVQPGQRRRPRLCRGGHGRSRPGLAGGGSRRHPEPLLGGLDPGPGEVDDQLGSRLSGLIAIGVVYGLVTAGHASPGRCSAGWAFFPIIGRSSSSRVSSPRDRGGRRSKGGR